MGAGADTVGDGTVRLFYGEKTGSGILLAPGAAADTTHPEWLGSMPAVWELIVGYSSLCRLTLLEDVSNPVLLALLGDCLHHHRHLGAEPETALAAKCGHAVAGAALLQDH